MDYHELLSYLEIDSPEDFQYFENIADILECGEEIDEEAFAELFSSLEGQLLSELIENYFEDMLDKIPDQSVEIYTLLSTIGLSLRGLAKNMDEESNRAVFISEIDRFRKWYMCETEVNCINRQSGEAETVPLGVALAIYRSEAITGEEYDYDFESCLDYPLTEYVISFGDMEREAAGENLDFMLMEEDLEPIWTEGDMNRDMH